jgi:hypothetical protein
MAGVPLRSAYADPSGISVVGQATGGRIDYSVAGGTPAADPAPPQAGAASNSAPTSYPAAVPYLTDNGSGGFCISVHDRSTTNAEDAKTTNDAANFVWPMLVGDYLLCPAPAAGSPPLPPAALAGLFWTVHGQDLLGRPAPSIAPGYGLAGKLGYLETHASTTQDFSNPTPLGPLGISAHGSFMVDWGDGSGWQGPYDNPGAPWPDGDITHSWIDVGQYDVRVAEVWTATWSLGGAQGSLAALRTQGSIPSFEIRQLQSIRNR